MHFGESEEQLALRKAVADLGKRYGHDYAAPRARAREPLTELWDEAGRSGFLGLNLPEQYGGGGAGMYELALVCEELNAAGCGLLMMVVSPAINGTIIAKFGSDEQKQRWLPGLSSGETIMSFGITEPDAGSNSHNITTTARRDGTDWVLNGRKIYVSGVDHADAILIVARAEDARTGRLKPALFAFPVDTPGFEYRAIDMDVVMPDKQFLLFLDDVRLPADALIGQEDAALSQLFAGLNPERIMASAGSVGMGRYALDRATSYAKEREVWGKPIGTHQGLSHPLAKAKVELELSRLMMQKAATLYDGGDEMGAGEAANMAKYAAAEASIACVDQAVQTLGGNGLAHEYGLGNLLIGARVARIAPVSREMVLNFVAQFSLGLPKSY
ncbi:acyl-CoA dehydrogenase family protein [Jatrophihabitans endophyticus]|uniref:acyl-CoA dehydrogenase family protein n=1 Tax=Jatrophihabitans endophyticus TaxID=1206085 RepID=UPI0019E3537F|nr:acyl-CoA dehydrogenase family protein [Jatrophihabitans endophyticus]MBE7187045.1 acyl-CoA/acyl-ACP dehydrogenase [Jatrophihabitans endophyticus]